VTNNLNKFCHWFEVNNLFVIERAGRDQLINAVIQFAKGDADMEFDLREELFGPGGYLTGRSSIIS
jgi:hypothetical protein